MEPDLKSILTNISFLLSIVLVIIGDSASRPVIKLRTVGSVVNISSLNSVGDDENLIKPGASVGRLRLGDGQDRTFQIFPFKEGVDEKSETEECGTEYLWVDSENVAKGNVTVLYQKSGVFQIEAATTRFHTGEGIRSLDSPERVRRYYRNLKAYALLHNSPMALGGGPLIFWVDWTKGIAFMFATGRSHPQRYLYSIIVFTPSAKFCPRGESINSPAWQQLEPYALSPKGSQSRQK